MNIPNIISWIIMVGVCLTVVFASAELFGDVRIDYEDEALRWQMSNKHGLPLCEKLGKMAELVQLARQETGHEYAEYHQSIETIMPDKKPVYAPNGEIWDTGEIRIIERREWHQIGRVVYSQVNESLPANVVGQIVTAQCNGGESH